MAEPAADGTPAVTRRHRLEALGARLGFGLFGLLPLGAASALGGWLGRSVGPRLGVSHRARRNLARFLPELPEAERAVVLRAMWDNLGRLAGELPHLRDFFIADTASRAGAMEVVGMEHFAAGVAAGKGVLVVGGHLANWELQALVPFLQGYETHVVYRAANNPLFDEVIKSLRSGLASGTIPKGPAGARQLIRLARQHANVGFLVDQKMNDGIAVPFFGSPAMTAPAAAELALRFGLPLILVRSERLGGARFRVTYFPPLEIAPTGDRQADVLAIMTAINRRLESWIRERPAQWLWVHQRWPD